MSARREITKKHAAEYPKASKKAKGVMLDQLVATTGWSKANARRAFTAALNRKGPARVVKRSPRPRTYGYDTLKLLIQIWNLAGRPVRDETGLAAAQLDPGAQGRRRARTGSGFVEADLVLHCGATLAGEFVHSLTVTDVFTGWTENAALRNGAHRWVIEAMTDIEGRLPFPLVGLDTDNGGEFINHALIKWAGDRDLFFTRSRPYKSNDNAHVEQKNGDVVRRHAFHYRYDTALELQLLNELYALVRVRLNMFTATTKAIDWRSNKHGRKTRVYDKPRTPYQRVLDSGTLTPQKAAELATLFEATNPAELTRQITAIQTRLIALAKDKTDAITASISRANTDEARDQLSRAS